MTIASIDEFLHLAKEDKIRPFVKSSPIPKKQPPLNVVVGNSFEDIVLDTSKDVLVMFTAPTCAKCRKINKSLKRLASKTKNIEDLVIAKIDMSANEIDGLTIKAHPTIKFYSKEDKSGVDIS